MSDDPVRPPPGPSSLDDLGARIARARGAQPADPPPGAGAPPSGLAAALRLSTELFAGVVVGFGLGWFFDKALGTSPFGLIVFILVGFAAGTINLIRSASRPSTASTGGKAGSGT